MVNAVGFYFGSKEAVEVCYGDSCDGREYLTLVLEQL